MAHQPADVLASRDDDDGFTDAYDRDPLLTIEHLRELEAAGGAEADLAGTIADTAEREGFSPDYVLSALIYSRAEGTEGARIIGNAESRGVNPLRALSDALRDAWELDRDLFAGLSRSLH